MRTILVILILLTLVSSLVTLAGIGAISLPYPWDVLVVGSALVLYLALVIRASMRRASAELDDAIQEIHDDQR